MVDHQWSLPIIGRTQLLGPIPLTTAQPIILEYAINKLIVSVLNILFEHNLLLSVHILHNLYKVLPWHAFYLPFSPLSAATVFHHCLNGHTQQKPKSKIEKKIYQTMAQTSLHKNVCLPILCYNIHKIL